MKKRQNGKYGLSAVTAHGNGAAVTKFLAITAVTLLLFTFASCDPQDILDGNIGLTGITGNQAFVGDTIHAEYSGNGTGDVTWQWLLNDQPIRSSGAKSDTYLIIENDMGEIGGSGVQLKAQVSFSDQSGIIVSQTITVRDSALSGKQALTGTVTISKGSDLLDGPPEVGDILTAAYVPGNATSGTPIWQWLVDDEPLSYTNKTTYEVTDDNVGKTIKARVSYSTYSINITSRATEVVLVKQVPPVLATEGLTYELINGGAEYRVRRGATIATGELVIASEHEGKPVTEIGSATDNISNGAFSHCTITKVIIPASIKTIGSNAFYNCTNLETVEFTDTTTSPANVTSIGSYAFSKCTKLEEITIPASVTEIKNAAFAGSAKLTSITVATGNTKYSSSGGILYNNDKTELLAYPSATGSSITIDPAVKTIGTEAFRNCSGLTSISIPSGVTTISSWAFYWCDGLTSVTIPTGVTSLGERAFFGCDKLVSVIFPAGITVFGKDAFPQGATDGDILKGEYTKSGGGAGTYSRTDYRATDWKKK